MCRPLFGEFACAFHSFPRLACTGKASQYFNTFADKQQSVEWFYKEFGKIKFEGLKKNFLRISNTIAELEEFGYLD